MPENAAKIGRNAPCPCGSGRKYKRCCLQLDRDDELLWRRQQRIHEWLPEELLSFAQEQLGPEAAVEGWEQFWLWDDTAPPMDADSGHLQVFIPWFFYDWTPDPKDTRLDLSGPAANGIAPAYLDIGGNDLDDVVRRYLTACLAGAFSFHEVATDVRPGHGMTLYDLLTGHPHRVLEREASRRVKPGDILFARIVDLDSVQVLDGCASVVIPGEARASVEALRDFMAHQPGEIDASCIHEYRFELLETYHQIVDGLIDPAPPALQTTDGDPWRGHELIFDIDSPQAAFDALKDYAPGIAAAELLAQADYDDQGTLKSVEIPWLGGRDGDTVLGQLVIDGLRLTARANSQPRAHAIREIVETSLGKGARYRTETVESPQAALDAPPDEPGHAPLSTTPADDAAVQQAVADMLARHYAGWPDEHLPALDGATPRQAVEQAAKRDQVAALVGDIERSLHDQVPGHATAIVAALRRDLGLPVPVS